MSTTFSRGENPLKADKLNTALSERISRSGDTMTGLLKLAGNPVSAFDAATKQYVDTQVSSIVLHGGVLTFNTRDGDVVLNTTDVTTALGYIPYDAANPAGYRTASDITGALIPYAKIDSPTFTGNPQAPTPAPGDADASIATTAFVYNALIPLSADFVTSFNTRKGAVTLTLTDVTNVLGYTPYDATNPAGYQTYAQTVATSQSVASTYVPLAQKASPLGVATLDAAGKLLSSQLPATATGTLSYKGGWNAATNTPVASSGAQMGGVVQLNGSYYVVTASGTTAAIDGNTTWVAGDWIASTGAVWQRVQNSTSPYLPLTGGTLSGLLTLSGDPSSPLHAATKQYTDTKLPFTGGTLTGDLFLNRDPVSNTQAATKAYADARSIAVAAGYLPLTGGTLTTPGTLAGVSMLTFTNLDTLGPSNPLLPDAVWSIAGSSGNVPVMLDGSGVFCVAALSGTLVADPTVPLGIASKQYIDNMQSNTLPVAVGTASAGVATTLSRSDHSHSINLSGFAPTNAPVFTTSVTLNGDTWIPSIEPDLIWSLRDANNNIAFWLDSSGAVATTALTSFSLTTGALTATSLSGVGSLSVTSAIFTQATIANELIVDQQMPDLIGAVLGTNGNVVSGYDVITGEFNAVSVNAGNVKINGAPINTAVPTAPSDSIDIRSAPYNAAGDGVRNHGYVTTSGSVLTITNFSGMITLAAVDATTARLDIVGTAWSGWAFQPHHEGKLLYLTVSGYTLLAAVKPHGYISGTAILLDVTGQTITPQTSVAGSLTLPAIDTTKPTTGKCLIVEGMGKYQYWTTTPVRSTDPVTPYGIHAWFTKTIASFTAPNQITITGSFPFNWTNQPSVVLWGTDDSAATVACSLDVFPLKKRIWFSGTGLYLLPSLLQDNSEYPNYVNVVAGNPGPLVNGIIWAGDNSQVYALTTGGRRLPHRVSSQGAPRYDSARKNVHGRLSFLRCAQIPTSQVINVLIEGDSLGVFNSQGQVAQVMGATRFMAEFMHQNPGRRINFYNTAVGGSTWAAIASQNASYNLNSGNPYKFYTVPKPISGTVKRMDFWSNVNRTGSGAPIVPDLIVMFNNAGNDRTSFDVNSMLSVINYIRNIAHGDSYGPTDFVMQTDHGGFQVYGDGVSGGTALPGAAAPSLNAYYNTGMNRTVAGNMGFPLVDYVPLIDRQAFGYDQTHRALRQVPQVTLNLSPTTPIGLSEDCLDFQFYISMAAATSEAAGWTTMQQLEIQISQNPGNRLFLRLGSNGSIWAASSSAGLFTDTVVTCTTSAKTITLGAATSYPANVTFRGGWAAVDCADASITFDPATMNGLCVIANTGNYDGVAFGRPKQRNWIRAVMEPTVAMLHQINADFSDVTLTPALPIQIGPNQFIEQDNRAQPDVVIFYPDGTIFSTQVAYGGYVSPTQATLVDTPPQALTAQTVPMFLGRMGMKWFDTGIKPSTTSTTGLVAVSVIGGAANFGWIDSQTNLVSQTYAYKTLERFGGAFTPVLYAKGAMQVTLVNRWVDEDIPIAASTPMWNQRGISSANSDYFTGGVGGHYGSFLQPAVLDALYSNQNLSVN